MVVDAFQLVVLGCTGGPRETNISGYMFSPLRASNEWIVVDAGSLLGGIDRALEKNSFKTVRFSDPNLAPAGELLIKHVKGFLISHAHLDHIAGLVLNSQVDEPKFILGIDPTIDNLRDHIFNGKIWPNYGSEGLDPILKLYEYIRLPLHKPVLVPSTTIHLEAYLLSHPHGYPSAGFLIKHDEAYFLYLGDTSSDLLEEEKHLQRVWRRIAPLIKEQKLHGILMECSYSKKDTKKVIYGHLDTNYMLKELHHLAEIAEVSLKGLKVIVTHRKESLEKGPDPKELIQDELQATNDLGIDFIFPAQGDRILM